MIAEECSQIQKCKPEQVTFKMNTNCVAHRCEGQTHLFSCISLHLSLSIDTVSVSINSEVPYVCFLYLFSHSEISEMISDNNSCLWVECFGLFVDSTEFTVALIIQSSLRECDIYACVYLFCQYLLTEGCWKKMCWSVKRIGCVSVLFLMFCFLFVQAVY